MSREVLTVGYEIKKTFLKEIIEERIWQKKPKNLSDKQWSMQRKIGFQYALTDKTLDELGKQYGGLTRENIRTLNRRFLDNIHKSLPPRLQAQYPRESIPDSKPRTRRSREKSSRSQRGSSWEISKFVLQTEITDSEIIADRLNIPRSKVNHARPVLRRWGIEISSTTSHYIDFAEKVKRESDDQKLQEILDHSSPGSLLHYRQKYGNETIISFAPIIREAGFYPEYAHTDLFADIIRKEGIPIKPIVGRTRSRKKYRQRYWILIGKHKERVIETLRNDSSLQRFKTNPVQLICGSPNARIPTLTELSAKKEYQPLSPLVLKTIGFRSSRAPQRNLGYLLNGCPAPVYKEGKSYFYPKDQVQLLKLFLVRRAREIQYRPSQVA